MIDTRFLRGSDGTGNAVAARVNTQRLVGSTVLKVDSVNKWPVGQFIATVGTMDVNGYLTSNVTEFRGHITAGDIIIDSYENGYADIGNLVNQYVILKQTTGWSNLIQDSLAELQNEDITRSQQMLFDFVQSGGIWSVASGLNGAMTAATIYINGQRATLAAVASRTFTINKDTYVDVLLGGTIYAPTLTLVYTEVTAGSASPALASNSIRLAVVSTSGSAITSITQNRPDPSYPNVWIRPNSGTGQHDSGWVTLPLMSGFAIANSNTPKVRMIGPNVSFQGEVARSSGALAAGDIPITIPFAFRHNAPVKAYMLIGNSVNWCKFTADATVGTMTVQTISGTLNYVDLCQLAYTVGT